MAQVTLNGVEIYLDTRTEANWLTVAKNIPKGFVCVAFVTEDSDIKTKIKIGDGTKTFSQLDYIGGDIDMSDVNTTIATALASYYTSAQTDSAIASAISAALSSVYSLKGRVDTTNDLPASGNKTGDVYMVGTVESLQKDEYYWTGTAWEFFGRTIDMSAYYTKSEIATLLAAKADTTDLPDMTQYYTTTQVDNLLNGKASTSDLNSVSGRVSAIEADYLKSTDKLILNCQLDTTTQSGT